ncbi:Iron-regulated protein A precursor [Labilithrix luteola]|uniref:Iron-regulated protein A n=1 Tax=Labilithrix luteola TaxID=1391654 RepID=A0A0K1QB52_9BACT|nr:imelysin family protein [Labilithrix luteola]AKV03016.1 Iron-regulated protein A precursor [Labilithrix luteola]
MSFKPLCLIPVLLLAAACSSSDDTSSISGTGGVDKAAVVKSYATIVHQNYEDSVAEAKKLQTAINAFVASPTQATFDAAKKAWIAARPAYLQTEAFRFYNGPIDNEENGPEGMINGWPLDENFIDYTIGNPEAGIINMTAEFPQITKDVIAENNEKDGEKNLSAGWHAIEFLLWGQDLNADGTPHAQGPGQRPYTDFVDGGTASNQARRREYLKGATDLLVEHIESVEVQWDLDNPESYGAKFVAGDSDQALSNILKGVISLAATELPKERMNNAYETKDQEEEHSCFSDTTNQDMIYDALGIENVYLGRYGSLSGPSISDLVKAKDPALDEKVRTVLTAALNATKAIPAPFDQQILGDDGSPGRQKVKAAIDAWTPVANGVHEAATALGAKINFGE